MLFFLAEETPVLVKTKTATYIMEWFNKKQIIVQSKNNLLHLVFILRQDKFEKKANKNEFY